MFESESLAVSSDTSTIFGTNYLIYVFNSSFIRSFVLLYSIFILFSVLYFTEGIFRRPTKIFWKIVKGTGLFYLLLLISILPYDKREIRQALTVFNSELNKPLPEKSYATNCDFTLKNVYDQLDIFVPLHLFGWFFKTLILRDQFIAWAISILFELLEYTFSYQLKNFNECWWDHWLLDVLICNWLGILFAKLFIKYFNLKKYNFVKKDINFKQYLLIIFMVTAILLLEINAFYLKALLWLPVESSFNLLRLVTISFLGAISMRELHEYDQYLDKEKIHFRLSADQAAQTSHKEIKKRCIHKKEIQITNKNQIQSRDNECLNKDRNILDNSINGANIDLYSPKQGLSESEEVRPVLKNNREEHSLSREKSLIEKNKNEPPNSDSFFYREKGNATVNSLHFPDFDSSSSIQRVTAERKIRKMSGIRISVKNSDKSKLIDGDSINEKEQQQVLRDKETIINKQIRPPVIGKLKNKKEKDE